MPARDGPAVRGSTTVCRATGKYELVRELASALARWDGAGPLGRIRERELNSIIDRLEGLSMQGPERRWLRILLGNVAEARRLPGDGLRDAWLGMLEDWQRYLEAPDQDQ